MIKAFTISLLILVAILGWMLFRCHEHKQALQQKEANLSIQNENCSPGFRNLSETQMSTELAHWNVEFRASLIGCEEELTGLTDEDIDLIGDFLQKPAEWSRILLPVKPQDQRKAERTPLVSRLNSEIESSSIEDIHFYDIAILDQR